MNKVILYGIIGLLLGVLITVFVASRVVNNNMTGMMRIMGMHISQNQMMNGNEEQTKNVSMHSDSSMSMQDMMNGLQEKTGDNLDKTFIAEMIQHHQGAIDMAKLAQKNAKHDEIKNLANDIISAQTKEINEMRDWQKAWGYTQ